MDSNLPPFHRPQNSAWDSHSPIVSEEAFRNSYSLTRRPASPHIDNFVPMVDRIRSASATPHAFSSQPWYRQSHSNVSQGYDSQEQSQITWALDRIKVLEDKLGRIEITQQHQNQPSDSGSHDQQEQKQMHDRDRISNLNSRHPVNDLASLVNHLAQQEVRASPAMESEEPAKKRANDGRKEEEGEEETNGSQGLADISSRWEEVSKIMKEKRKSRQEAEDRVSALWYNLGVELDHLSDLKREEEKLGDELASWTLHLSHRLQDTVAPASPIDKAPDKEALLLHSHGPEQPGDVPEGETLASHYYSKIGTSAPAPDLIQISSTATGVAEPKYAPSQARDIKLQEVLKQLQGVKQQIASQLGQSQVPPTELSSKGGPMADNYGIPPVYTFAPPLLGPALPSYEYNGLNITELRGSQVAGLGALESSHDLPIIRCPSSVVKTREDMESTSGIHNIDMMYVSGVFEMTN